MRSPLSPTLRAFPELPKFVNVVLDNPERVAAFAAQRFVSQTMVVPQVWGLAGLSRMFSEHDAIVGEFDRAESNASRDGFTLEFKKPEAS